MTSQDTTTEESGPKALREARDRALERVAELETKVAELTQFKQATILQTVGLDPEAGWGKVLVRDIDNGVYTGEVTAEDVTKYLAEAYSAEVAPKGGNGAGGEATQQEVQEAAASAQQRADKLAAVDAGAPTTQPDAGAEADKKIADGDIAGAVRTMIASQADQILQS